jgi:hypothetical protein
MHNFRITFIEKLMQALEADKYVAALVCVLASRENLYDKYISLGLLEFRVQMLFYRLA